VALALLPDERLSPRRAAGLATGFAGVFVVLGERLTWNEPVGAAIIVAGAALTQARPRASRAAASAGPAPRVHVST
jgi:drug/metabolite transporter (DMT)-like permease